MNQVEEDRFKELYDGILALCDKPDTDLVMGITACMGAAEAILCVLMTLTDEDGKMEAMRLANAISERMDAYAMGINPLEDEELTDEE